MLTRRKCYSALAEAREAIEDVIDQGHHVSACVTLPPVNQGNDTDNDEFDEDEPDGLPLDVPGGVEVFYTDDDNDSVSTAGTIHDDVDSDDDDARYMLASDDEEPDISHLYWLCLSAYRLDQ
jgi:hypothetical protein